MDTGPVASIIGEQEARSLGHKLHFTDSIIYGPGKSKLHVRLVAKVVLIQGIANHLASFCNIAMSPRRTFVSTEPPPTYIDPKELRKNYFQSLKSHHKSVFGGYK